ncbi:MAG: integrase domain-containing protein, partial [Tatlockia sp.]|nr:integrase domain-containing protein [Tatlockia sp.]
MTENTRIYLVKPVDNRKATNSLASSFEGQALFGFRREESLKFILNKVRDGDYLNIQPSWTKGGIGRIIKIRTDEQRQWLDRVEQLVKPGYSLIPADKSYKQQIGHYKTTADKLGLVNLHGLRHAYAQRRYQ